ncbi:isoprenyl transferase [Pectinatus sottacetonis]|uniref:isoprenyl transferase n=1 Tax=Pectinatus sottacetonis TaxID=1002795 RepID=UPI0018C6A922|nr:isoprenyl transferase [Pectinatus sottacetonis]
MWKDFFYKNEKNENEKAFNTINAAKLPTHIAIIMDGNGRWASKKGLPRKMGHKKGVSTLKSIVHTASDINIKYLTVYAFSTENWKRPLTEVNFLMKLFSYYLDAEIDEMYRKNVHIDFIGGIKDLSLGLQEQIEKARKKTADNDGLHLNIAVNYGGRDEIVMAVKKLAQMASDKKINALDIDAKMFDDYLYTAHQPAVDLLIRTSGDMRISNFLLWQCAYAEFWFTKKNWPEFMPEDFIQAIMDYQKRDRKFGGLNV